MAAPLQRPQQKGASPWGWMQQAVASVESKLDTILGEDDESVAGRTTTPAPPPARPASTTQNAPIKRDSMEAARSGASTPVNDRLQARLAKAMAAKKAAAGSDTPVPRSEPVSRPDSPSAGPHNLSESSTVAITADEFSNDTEATQPKQGTPVALIGIEDNATGEDNSGPSEVSNDLSNHALRIPLSNKLPGADNASARTSAELISTRPSLSDRPSTDSLQIDARNITSQLEQDKAQQDMSDEINGYIERIDALQAKLKYLTAEAADVARNAATAAQNGSAERRLFEKDEKIALLMQEGQSLSKSEMKHLQTIKKIRQQYLSVNKDHDATKARADKAERSLRIMEDRAKRAEATTKRTEQNLASSLSASNDFDTIKKERDALTATLTDIRAQLSRANARAENAEGKAETEQLERERKKNTDLQDDITSLKVERELAEEKLRREVKDFKALVEREKEHSRAMETEMLGEQATLESKLESFRARAEEASSSNQGDVQAKLLRQIETLQNQYSTASQNWQGIEGSLLARIAALEKERDEIATRESDVRRKLREAVMKTKKAERETEEAQTRLPDLEKAQIEAEEEIHRSSRKIKQLESDLKRSQQNLEEHKVQAEKEMHRRLEEEKTKWTSTLQTHRMESPATSLRKGSGLGFDLTSPLDRPVSRRASYLPNNDSFTPPRQQSLASLKGLSNGTIAESPSLDTSNDADEYFNNIPATPASQSHAASPRALHDLMSNSTVAAGPSVQLVERMSANVRRLESEKAAAKDELTRLTSQRDEARLEVVSLMREVEQTRKTDERLKALETDHKDLAGRYQTTLELLGEKSEQVEELKADIVDVKQMYRQLADTMGQK